jgi:AraC family transcriptional regulator
MGSVYRGAEHRLGPNQFDALLPGETHTGFSLGKAGWKYRCFYFDPPYVQTMLGAHKRCPDRSATRESASVYHALHRAHTLLERGHAELEAEALIGSALAVIFHSYDPTAVPDKPDSAKLNLVREILAAHLADQVSIQAIAQRVDLHPVYLVRAFRVKYGLPPHAFQRQLRIERAKGLLARGESIADVALAVGMADQSHLTRLFRSVLGITPAAYAAGSSRSRQ